MNLTVLLVCKDRKLNTEYCLASINRCNPRPKTILVDFGSKKSLKYYESIYDWLQVIRMDCTTEMFHKARAINIAIKATKTSYICATDVDQIFNKNFFGVVKNRLVKNRTLVMCKSWFLQTHPKVMGISSEELMKQYNKILKVAKNETNKIHGEGCCISLPIKWLRRVRGWDEKFIGYGGEDSDIIQRAVYDGFNKTYIHNKTNIIHMPHPKKRAYYNKYFGINKRRYKAKGIRQIIANQRDVWGKR